MTDDFYKSIIEHYPVGYVHHKIIYDKFDMVKDYEFVEINKEFEKIIGVEKKNLIGYKASNVLRGRFSWVDFYNHIINDKLENKEFKYYFEILDRYYKINVHYPNQDNIIIFLRDTTRETKQKENYELFAENTEIQIWHLQDPFTYGSSNKAHADFLGLEKKDIEFKSIYDFYTPEEAAICIDVNKKVFKERKKVASKEWIINSKGKRRLVNVLKTPKFNQKGEVEFIVCSAEDITEEYEMEEEKKIKERILYSMIDFTEELLTNDNHYKALCNGIAMIGNATKADRVYYWENHYDKEKKEWLTSQKFEWCLGGVEEQIDNPDLQNNRFEEVGDFVGVLSKNKPFITHVKDMEDTFTKEILASQGILSILVLPVFANDEFEGFIGFDSCRFERKWSNVEISLLNSFVLLYEKAVEKNFLKQHVNQVKKNFDNFFNMVNDFLFVFNKDGNIINANETALKELGYSRSEIIGQSALKLHPKDRVEKSQSIMRNVLKGEITNFSSIVSTKKGSIIPIETHISKGIWDDEDVLFAVSKDVSDLAISEEKFSKAFNLSGISMVMTSFDEEKFEDIVFVEVNDTFLKEIGYKRDEVIGKKVVDLNGFKDLIKGRKLREEIKKKGALYNYEVEMISRDNNLKIGLCNTVSLKINNETYLLTSIIDITERELMIKELAKAKKASDVANGAKSEFLSHMSHEIRTPMNAVIGYSDLLSSTKLTERQERYIDGVKASSEMLMSIINDILDWSKIDNDKLKLENKAFNIDEVIINVVEQQKFKNVNNEVRILVEKEGNVPSILYGDFLRLQQVLLNLLSNAVKFTPAGEIIIKVKLVETKTDKIRLKIEVIDTGIGIPEEAIKDIFEPFKQSNSGSTSKYGGSGLGLSIAEKIVKLMNGSIGVKSKVNEGSNFFFTADFYTKNIEDYCIGVGREVCQKKKINLSSELKGLEVLIVDDNEINQDVLSELLQAFEIRVSFAISGMEAIEKCKVNEYDIIFMDLRMPIMDGYETTSEIRKIKSFDELPIIAVTASASPDEVKKCKKFAMQDLVTKPIEKEKLFESIIKSIGLSSQLENQVSFIEKDEKKSKDDLKIDYKYKIDGIDIEKALKHLNNNENLFMRILKRFKNNHSNVINEIKEALSVGDNELAIRLAHTIKGVSGELSAGKVYSTATKLEGEMMNGNFEISGLLNQLEKELKKIFSSEIFLEEEEDESKSKVIRKLDLEEIKPLLKKLEKLLLEYNLDAMDYIKKIEEISKNTFIENKVKEMKEYGEGYDFDGAKSVFNDISLIIDEKE